MAARIFFLLLIVFGGALQAQVWTELGPCGSENYGNSVAAQGGTGQIHTIVFDPDNPQIVYCGAPFGGLWRSTDGGKSWSNQGLDTNTAMIFSSVSDMVITRVNGKKYLWVATGHPGARGDVLGLFEPYTCGIYRSDDEGSTFYPVNSFNEKCRFAPRFKKHISTLAAHPSNGNILYAATSDGLYQTLNNGKSWKLVLTETELPGSSEYTQGIFGVAFSLTQPDKTIYATGKDVYRSDKSGKRGSFKTMTRNTTAFFDQPDCLADVNFNVVVNKADNTDALYVCGYVKGDTCGAYRRKSDYVFFYFNGKNWQQGGVPPVSIPDGIRLKMATVPGEANIVYAGSGVTAVSTNYGKTWKQATDYNQPGHADIHAITVIPGTRDMLVGTDGGIFKYEFSSAKVMEYNNGLCISQVLDMGTSATDPRRILIGKQDTGADIWDGEKWTKLPGGGDGYPVQVVDHGNGQLFSCHNFQLMRMPQGGKSMVPVNTCLRNTCPSVMQQHPDSPKVFFMAHKEVYRSADGGQSWCRISDFAARKDVYINPVGQIISALSIAPSNTSVIYAAFNAYPECCNSIMFRTNSGGNECQTPCGAPQGAEQWERIDLPRLETGDSKRDFSENSFFSVSGIAVSDKNPDHLWISYRFQDLKDQRFKVFESRNGGRTWSSDDEDLPPYPVTRLVYVPGSDDAIFAGTWQGVYYKKKGEAWRRYGRDFPRMYVSDLEINPVSRTLRASVFGRGVWETELPDFRIRK